MKKLNNLQLGKYNNFLAAFFKTEDRLRKKRTNTLKSFEEKSLRELRVEAKKS